MSKKRRDFIKLIEENHLVFSLGLQLTERCNLKCDYCFQDKPKGRTKELEAEKWIEIVNLFEKIFNPNIIQYKLTGGEVFVFDGVNNLIGNILNTGSNLTVISNGVSIPDDYYFLSKAHPKNSFTEISIDGPEEIHNKYRGKFSDTMENIKRFLDEGLNLALRISAHRGNYDHIGKFLENMEGVCKFKNRDIVVHFQPIFLTEKNNSCNLELGIEEYYLLSEKTKKSSYSHISQNWRIVDGKAMKRDYKPESKLKSIYFGCDNGATLMIRPNGDFSGCELEEPKDNILRYLDSKEQEKLLSKIDEINTPADECISCEFIDTCNACRLTPSVHNYTSTFGYDSCKSYAEKLKILRERRYI